MASGEIRRWYSELGRKGGAARAKKLSKKRRQEISRKAVRARWDRRKKSS